MKGQQSMFNRAERDQLALPWKHLEWERLTDEQRRLVGRAEPLGEAVSRGARLTPEAERLVAAASAQGLLGWLRPESRDALQRLLAESS